MLLFIGLAHAEDLYVSSNERGAAILLNGIDTGYTTPSTVPGVKPGPTLVTVESGCARGEQVVDVLPGLVTRASIVADEQLGTLTLVPVPSTARIELDGKLFPGAPGIPTALSCGDHTVRATLEGHVPAVLTIDLAMGQDLTVPISLQKLGIGMLELSVKPRTGSLYVDGKPIGTDAVTLPSVYQGVHVISAELDGYQSARKQVVVEEGGTQAFHFELARTSQSRVQSTVTRLGGTGSDEGERAADHEGTDDADTERTTAARVEAAADREADAEREAEAAGKREAERTAAREREAEADAEAEKKAEARRSAKSALSDERDEAGRGEARRGSPVGKTIGGVSLLAAGAGAGVYGALAYRSAAQAYDSYAAKFDNAGTDKQRQRLADEYYDDNVVPRRSLLYGSAIGSAVFLAGGVVVLVVDAHLPIFAPAPGGGMVLWNGRF